MTSRSNQITRFSKQRVIYRTITANLELLPVTGELKMLINDQAIWQSIRNLISTFNGERYYHPEIGSTISRDLFEFADEFTCDRIKSSVLQTLQNFEPRASNPQVVVTPFPTDSYVNVDIFFSITNLPGQVFQVPTIVIRTR